MKFSPLDWLAVAAYFAITLIFGTYFRQRSGKSTEHETGFRPLPG